MEKSADPNAESPSGTLAQAQTNIGPKENQLKRKTAAASAAVFPM
jgi:hypothetical protein